MKYYLQQATPRLYFVVDEDGFKFSKKPAYKKQARAQQKALYASQEQKKREKKGRPKRVRGGAIGDEPTLTQLAVQAQPAPAAPQASFQTGYVGRSQADVDLTRKLQNQQVKFSATEKSSPYGQYAVPYVPPKDMQARGIPWFLAQHPNQYSANPNEVLLYRNEGQFLRSAIYQKYKDRITPYEERAGYGIRFAQIIPGKPFRIVFRSRSFDDNNQYYLDLNDANEFMDFLDDAKDSNMLTPVEFISAVFTAKNKAEMSKIASDSAEAYKVAYTQGTKDQLALDQQAMAEEEARRAAEEAAQRQQQQGEEDDDSGFMGALGAVGSVVGKVFDFL